MKWETVQQPADYTTAKSHSLTTEQSNADKRRLDRERCLCDPISLGVSMSDLRDPAFVKYSERLHIKKDHINI